MLKRKYEQEILDYIKSDKQALLVTGARQTGKTYLIREMCKKSGMNVVEINLIEQPEAAALLKTSKSAEEALLRLSLIAGPKMEKHNTVFFFDEIQMAGDIVTLIKFLVEEGSYHYVLSGSLLGVELTDIRSVPVGYLHIVEMFPLDFQEFLWAIGVSEQTLQSLQDHYDNKKPLDSFVHQKLLEFFYRYLIIGGMPQAVQTYIDTNDLNKVANIHRDITETYKRDFTQYEKSEKLKLISIYDLIPSELNKQNKRFVFTYLNKQLKFDRYENSFLWLKDAGVAIPVYNASEPHLPLEQSKSSNLFKLFMSDVGLLNSHYSAEVKMKILMQDGSINNGALFENAVAQQMTANGLKVYYFKNVKNGEVDFITEIDGKCVPIEVKSGKGYKNHAALNNMMNCAEYHLSEAIVLCDGNIEVDGRITYLPVYMAMFLKNTELESVKLPIDLGGL